jgi:hypothetical protein
VAVTSDKPPVPTPSIHDHPADDCREPEVWTPIAPPQPEWIIAAMIGLGVALGAAGGVAFVESNRYGPAPPAEVGANEWATPNPKPPKSAAVPASDEIDFELDEPLIDIEIRGSASAGASNLLE